MRRVLLGLPAVLFFASVFADGFITLNDGDSLIDAVPKNAAISLPTSDLYGNLRPQGAGYDLGCYEGQKSGLMLLAK